MLKLTWRIWTYLNRKSILEITGHWDDNNYVQYAAENAHVGKNKNFKKKN
jgi:hypothetical protein